MTWPVPRRMKKNEDNRVKIHSDSVASMGRCLWEPRAWKAFGGWEGKTMDSQKVGKKNIEVNNVVPIKCSFSFWFQNWRVLESCESKTVTVGNLTTSPSPPFSHWMELYKFFSGITHNHQCESKTPRSHQASKTSSHALLLHKPKSLLPGFKRHKCAY